MWQFFTVVAFRMTSFCKYNFLCFIYIPGVNSANSCTSRSHWSVANPQILSLHLAEGLSLSSKHFLRYTIPNKGMLSKTSCILTQVFCLFVFLKWIKKHLCEYSWGLTSGKRLEAGSWGQRLPPQCLRASTAPAWGKSGLLSESCCYL